MHTLLEDIDLLLTPAPPDTAGLYDRVADQYEQFRSLWITVAGGAVERPMLEELRAILAPGLRVLDAGCGTGTLSRRIHTIEPTANLTLLDFSSAMLAHTNDIPPTRIQGSVLALPFPDNAFDICRQQLGDRDGARSAPSRDRIPARHQ